MTSFYVTKHNDGYQHYIYINLKEIVSYFIKSNLFKKKLGDINLTKEKLKVFIL